MSIFIIAVIIFFIALDITAAFPLLVLMLLVLLLLVIVLLVVMFHNEAHDP